MEEKLAAAVAFFKQETGFHRLMALLIEKYKGLGRIGGSVTLKGLTPREKEMFSVFFRKDCSDQRSITITFAQFADALEKTKFAGVDVKELLAGYAGGELLTKAEEKRLYEEKKQAFFSQLLEKYSHPHCRLWIEKIVKKGAGTRGIHLNYDKNPEILKLQLENVLSAISQLPKEGYERLPVFANRITKDPHGFDYQTEQGRFLLSALQWMLKSMDASYEISSPSAEEMTEILQHFGLFRDDILNFVTCAGILGFQKGVEEPLPLWEAAWRGGSVLNVPLREIIRVSRCRPALSFFYPKYPRVVFIVENSGVFSSLMDHFTEREGLLPAIICTHGQFKLAALILLDKLAAEGVELYYSGDFDPEGLQMAQRLLQRYPEHVKLWRYSAEDYERCAAKVEKMQIDLGKMASVTTPLLLLVKEKMLAIKKPGYQEELIAEMVEDIEKLI
jgi:uncharacterized protein (TIGR02679 family)